MRAADLLARARAVRLMVFDVDGVMTDGALWYGPRGEAFKRFHAYDGHGVKMLAAAGVASAILSGRRSKAVARRAAELGIKDVFQGVDDKLLVFMNFSKKKNIPAGHIGYMGDELVDLPVLERCGFACAPQEAPAPVRRRVHYVAKAPAGGGAVREVCELIIRARA